MVPVFLILTVIIRNGIQSQYVNDLTSLVVPYDLMLVDRTGIRTSVARKTVGIITIHFCTINRPVRRHLVLTYFYKFIPVTFGHVNVHIIVPWDKAFISKNTDQSTSGHYISKIMLFADRINLPEELQKKLDAVYTQLGDGTIQPMAAAPGADVRKTFASNCLTLHYWILQSVKVSK